MAAAPYALAQGRGPCVRSQAPKTLLHHPLSNNQYGSKLRAHMAAGPTSPLSTS